MARADTPHTPTVRYDSWDGTPSSDWSWQQVAATVATAAGGAAWVSTIGSGVVALRMREAHLPIEPVVALMSAEHRFAVGGGVLIAPLFAGFIGFLVDWAFGKQVSLGARLAMAFGTVVAAAALVYLVLRPPYVTFLVESLAVAVAVTIAFLVLANEPADRHTLRERLAVFLTALVAAGAGAIVGELFRTPTFDEAAITIRDPPARVTGGYITTTEHSVVLTPRCEIIEAVPRAEIARITVGPGAVERTEC